jgi:ketose-bisphosphate aldolase
VIHTPPSNVYTLREVLRAAEQGGYAVGSFSPRYTPMIRPILRAGQHLQAPLIVQISQKELLRYVITPAAFAQEFYQALHDEQVTVPVVLHLDHTKELALIDEAIRAGFTSVMIDASDKPLEQNIALTADVVARAREDHVSVEAELGRIGTTDFVETETDDAMYTDPAEAERFVRETQVDALAVSIGTAHGVYHVGPPVLDYLRLAAIRQRVGIPLVLHGGSGVPAEAMQAAIRLAGGGVSKVNIATDLELALLKALGRDERMTNAQCSALAHDALLAGQAAVQRTTAEKITTFLRSQGHAGDLADSAGRTS